MGKQIGIGTYWLGSLCAALALFARGLDVFGKNFLDFNTKGGGIGYHTLMDGTLFFYAIPIATMIYSGFNSLEKESSSGDKSEKTPPDTLL